MTKTRDAPYFPRKELGSVPIIVSGPFDDLRSHDLRFLQEGRRLGPLHVLLWGDALCRALTNRAPKFPLAERLYYLQAIRTIDRVHVVDELSSADALPTAPGVAPRMWAVPESLDTPGKKAFCTDHGIAYHVIRDSVLTGLPVDAPLPASKPGRKKVLVTGCYDWFHTGHIRFFEECSELGDLYVVVGHDANIRLLKGEGHPMFAQDERRYVVGSIRYVTAALISTGSGWMDAAPQIDQIRPDIYAVNEDGDKPEKRQFCADRKLEYVVLKRLPKPGLPRRQSTHLRGF